ncbi:hypothetical protein JDM601_3726 [Mycolicibacter sinensis]|uniref:Uncharacterized protein n=1 Tax=Mycolicibacter sinensis (strain JDM601) TaxID=875328 RepID=F5Z344_MYCSD|nr:hypothetical protein JDM601_3726 [Mycolicibacter sinensis]
MVALLIDRVRAALSKFVLLAVAMTDVGILSLQRVAPA